MHLHILGICGTFMGGLAALAREAGHRVTGCDAQVYPPMSEQLRALGIDLIEGYDPAQRALAADCWVIGNAITRGNPLLEALLDAGDRLISGPQWLAEHLLGGRTVLAVAGTHGKTTTASLLAYLLQQTGQRPGFLIGGVPLDFGVSARLGEGSLFVIEADEYDTAFFDKRSKFVHYRSRIALLNNLEFDHADIFPDLAAIETQFHHLVRTLPRQGAVVVNGADEALQRVLGRGLWSTRVEFGVATGWHDRNAVEEREATRFELYRGEEPVAAVSLPLAGAHNRSNAVAAIATAACVGVDPVAAAQALAGFGGVRRRLEERGCVRGVTVIDDFAHHPSAIQTTVAGLRARIGGEARILAVIEPRSNTMRLGTMKSRLPESLAQADRVYCYAAGLDWSAAEALAPLGERAWVGDDLEQLVARVVADARPSDRVLVMSNRAFGGVHGKLLEALAGVAQ